MPIFSILLGAAVVYFVVKATSGHLPAYVKSDGHVQFITESDPKLRDAFDKALPKYRVTGMDTRDGAIALTASKTQTGANLIDRVRELKIPNTSGQKPPIVMHIDDVRDIVENRPDDKIVVFIVPRERVQAFASPGSDYVVVDNG